MRWGSPPGPHVLDDAMQRDSLIDAYDDHELMGMTGERIATKLGLTRDEVDRFGAAQPPARLPAVADGTFAREIVPVPPTQPPPPTGLDHDEGYRGPTRRSKVSGASSPRSPRRDCSRPAIHRNCRTERRRSSSRANPRSSAGSTPLAWIHSAAESGVHPRDVMESPIPTVRDHLAKTGLKPSDFDRVEHNEAYASASIAVQRAFGFTEEQFNVHGGAIALGHPIGASGARIVVSLVHELARSRGRLGLATLCMGGGNGLSLAVERPS